MTTRARSRISWTGFLFGAAIGTLVLLGWRVPDGKPALGAEILIATGYSRHITLEPTGPIVSTGSLEAGQPPVGGSLRLVNRTGEARKVQARISAEALDLDQLLRVQITSRGTTLYRGTLAGSQRWSATSLLLPSRRSRPLTLRVWLPAGIGDDYRYRALDGLLELKTSRLP